MNRFEKEGGQDSESRPILTNFTAKFTKDAQLFEQFRFSLEESNTCLARYAGSLSLDEGQRLLFNGRINGAFLRYWLAQRWRFLTDKQAARRNTKLLVALKRLKLILPDRDDTYFDTLALVGEVSIRQRKPAWWAHKDCDEFLSNLIVGLDELITWLDTPGSSDAGPSDWTPAYPWTTLWLIGEELPDIYSETFARKYGLSEKGPGPRFVKTLLRLAKAKKLVDQNFTDLTIMGYRRRALKLGKGAFAWPAPSAR